jgi:flagellar protein FliO/FliZ
MDIPEIVLFAAALVFVLALIFLIAWVLRRFFSAGGARGGQMTGRRRSRRLGILEATQIGTRHRLVLVRRDDVEHLLLIGGSSELVVERSIPHLDAEAEVNIRAVEPRFESGGAGLSARSYEAPYERSALEPAAPTRSEMPYRAALATDAAPESARQESGTYRFGRASPTAAPSESDYQPIQRRSYPEPEEEAEPRRDALSDMAARYRGRAQDEEPAEEPAAYEEERGYEEERDYPAAAEDDNTFEIDDTAEGEEEPAERPRSPILSRYLKRDER